MHPTLYQLNLRTAGMFSNVNEVVQHLYLAEQGDYQFTIAWDHCCYLEPAVGPAPWLYYFEPCFDRDHWPDALPALKGGTPVACSKDNIITPRMVDGKCSPLLLPKDRQPGYRIIERYIKLNAETAKVVDTFAERFHGRHVIGLHIRGLGRNHGGASALRWKEDKQKPTIDYGRYISEVDQHLSTHPDALIFVCSDSQTVVDEITRRYGERVLCYPSTRSDFGEMHADHAKNAGMVFSPHKLGLDIVAEAYLLARTNFLVHGNSNVANFVLCQNPLLPSVYVYADETEKYIQVHSNQN